MAPPPTGGVTDTGGDAQGAQTAKAEVKRLFSLLLRPDEQTDGKAFQGGEEKGALGGGGSSPLWEIWDPSTAGIYQGEGKKRLGGW